MTILRRRGDFFGCWRFGLVALTGLVLAAFLYRSDWPFYRALQRRGVAADGWATVKGLGAPDNVGYSFEAGGRTYGGVGKAGYGNRPLNELKPGDRLLVYYLPDHPETHCLGDPSEHLRDQNRAMFVPLALFSIALAVVLARELKRHG